MIESLEDELKKIDDLQKDLSAEIVVQEEKGYWGPPHRRFHTGERGCYDADEAVWEVTQPRITKPDVKKIESTKTRLQQIYDASEWYCLRYAAGKALSSDIPLDMFVKELGEGLDAKKMGIIVFETYRDSRRFPGVEYYDEEREALVPDEPKRKKAIVDAYHLYSITSDPSLKELLKRTYKLHENNEIRREAGKALGYSIAWMAISDFLKKHMF